MSELDVTVFRYSDRLVAVYGDGAGDDTDPHSKYFKDIGGKYESLDVDGEETMGWVFPLQSKSGLMTYLNDNDIPVPPNLWTRKRKQPEEPSRLDVLDNRIEILENKIKTVSHQINGINKNRAIQGRQIRRLQGSRCMNFLQSMTWVLIIVWFCIVIGYELYQMYLDHQPKTFYNYRYVPTRSFTFNRSLFNLRE